MGIPPVEQAVEELEERIGHLHDLDALARYCQVSRRQLRRALERAGVPVIEVGRKQLVQRGLAEQALGLDFAELLLEIRRNEAWMRQREFDADGRQKTASEYAEQMSAIAIRALQASVEADDR